MPKKLGNGTYLYLTHSNTFQSLTLSFLCVKKKQKQKLLSCTETVLNTLLITHGFVGILSYHIQKICFFHLINYGSPSRK